jgi:hypothetical protein
MNALKHFLCWVIGYCQQYEYDDTGTEQRFQRIEHRVDRLERKYWKPRDLIDIR